MAPETTGSQEMPNARHGPPVQDATRMQQTLIAQEPPLHEAQFAEDTLVAFQQLPVLDAPYADAS